jgi:hypothetical protein
MKSARTRLTYANVISTLGVFLLLAGGTAIAAKQLGKKTVGAKQLKSNAVTTAKIKKAAVTKVKIKDGAIDSTKLADGSVTSAKIVDGAVTGAKIAVGSTVFSQRVARLSSNAAVPFAASTVYPVGSYTQNAGEDNQVLAAYDVRFGAGCAPPRSAVAYLLMDSANPAAPMAQEIIGFAFGQDSGSGQSTRRFDFPPFTAALNSMNRTAPRAATSHTFHILLLGGGCSAGAGVDMVGALVDVIGTK